MLYCRTLEIFIVLIEPCKLNHLNGSLDVLVFYFCTWHACVRVLTQTLGPTVHTDTAICF